MKNKIKPYTDLVRNNVNYRRLWLAQIISNFGDWFGILAVYAIIQKYSGSEFLLGLIIVVKMLSLAFSSPLAGYITDRFNRRHLMFMSDIARGILVLCFILITTAELLWLAYVITALQMVFSAVFEPAKTSSIPNVTSDKELVVANILSAASWSIIFTSGMAIGGFATAYLGTDVVFMINGFSYALSSVFIYRANIPQKMMSSAEKKRTSNPLVGITEGFRYLKNNSQVLRPAMAKGTFTMCVGAMVYMLIIIAEDVLMLGSIGLGILYAARGVGTGLGPVVGRRIFKLESGWIRAIGFFMIFCGLMYGFVSSMNSIILMSIFVMLAHMASGSNWVFSTVLLQRRAPDVFRGRVFSIEWLIFTVAQSFSVMAAALILELDLLTIRQTMGLFSGLLVLSGIAWLYQVAPKESLYSEESKTHYQTEKTII
ncbi:MAG: MFS transporter [Balneolaceae bacterium]|nr:MFS transporter [Balneolaceae bacterium]